MDPKDLVSLTQDHATTTSLIVAEKFGKRHADVLRAIEKLIAECPDPGFIERNFAFNEYTDPIGRTLPMYRIARDGFSLLAMGFTGKEALGWKLQFIAAFNTLEALADPRLLSLSHRLRVLEAEFPRLDPLLAAQFRGALMGGFQMLDLALTTIGRAIANGTGLPRVVRSSRRRPRRIGSDEAGTSH